MQDEKRSTQDRRSGKDRRRLMSIKHLFFRYPERREGNERRQSTERRNGWVRISKWASVYLPSLKISKFIRPWQ